MNVLVEPEVHDVFARIPGFGFVQTFYIQDTRYKNKLSEHQLDQSSTAHL